MLKQVLSRRKTAKRFTNSLNEIQKRAQYRAVFIFIFVNLYWYRSSFFWLVHILLLSAALSSLPVVFWYFTDIWRLSIPGDNFESIHFLFALKLLYLSCNEAWISFKNFPRPFSTALKWAIVACFSFTLTREDYTPSSEPNLDLLHAAKAIKIFFLKATIFYYF